MKILHVNQQIGPGGASGVCLALHNSLQAKGHESAVLVGRRKYEMPGVDLIEHDRYRSAWGRFWLKTACWLNRYAGRIRGADRLSTRWLPRMASPRRFASWRKGHEDFNFPGTVHLIEQAPFMPDALHLHNLHGEYFDLRALPLLSQTVPTVITLHDAWMLAGHCAHSFDCEKWKTGCASCSRLDIPPALRRDGAAFNWQRKQRIYKNSKLTVVCPSQWLAEKVCRSILMPAIRDLIVIPNGVDTTVFRPGDKTAARNNLGWPQHAFITMFAANGVRQSIWKDYCTMRDAIRLVGEVSDIPPIRFFAIGDSAPSEQVGSVTIEFLPYRDSLSECYQAADVYLHAAKVDTFPTSIIEALACGIPVVATSAGGIPEQIMDGKTGYLVPGGDSAALAKRLICLARSPEQMYTMGIAASRDVLNRFSLEQMTNEYTNLYQEMIEREMAARET